MPPEGDPGADLLDGREAELVALVGRRPPPSKPAVRVVLFGRVRLEQHVQSRPTTLRAVLLENLCRPAERSTLVELARELTHRGIDQDDAARRPRLLVALRQAGPEGAQPQPGSGRSGVPA